MSSKGKRNQEKGAKTEEVLATYFRQAGYFVVRGVPFEYSGYSVTDIDLWLYIRSSSVSREIAIVDIKKKKTPQAIERIFWTKGLQSAVGANRAIVATTDSREEVANFGRQLDVKVLGGKFLKRLESSDKSKEDRISEEDFAKLINESTLGKLDGNWKGRLECSKRELAHGLSFDSINFWLEQGRYFAEQVINRPINRDLALRALLRIVSYIAIGVDFVLKELSFEESDEKKRALKSGFTYGDGGEKEVCDTIDRSLSLLEQFGEGSAGNMSVVKANIQKAFEGINTDILSEYFSKVSVARSLVHLAIELDAISMGTAQPSRVGLSQGGRALIGCLLDFWQLDRSKFGLNELYNNSLQSDV